MGKNGMLNAGMTVPARRAFHMQALVGSSFIESPFLAFGRRKPFWS
jgi:hypothetical protein